MSHWIYDDDLNTDEIFGLDCHIHIQRRPAYCDRGNFLANVELKEGGDHLRLWLDSADGWPRYYMNLDRAKAEIEDWMKKRKQWVEEK
jgi:hypothetical protein